MLSLGVVLTGGTEGTIAGGMGDGTNFPSASLMAVKQQIMLYYFVVPLDWDLVILTVMM